MGACNSSVDVGQNKRDLPNMEEDDSRDEYKDMLSRSPSRGQVELSGDQLVNLSKLDKEKLRLDKEKLKYIDYNLYKNIIKNYGDVFLKILNLLICGFKTQNINNKTNNLYNLYTYIINKNEIYINFTKYIKNNDFSLLKDIYYAIDKKIKL